MVGKFLAFAGKEIRGMHQAAYLLATFALGSQLLALVRDRLLAGEFGASQTLDLYYAAFRIPDLLFATVASLVSLYALLPVLTQMTSDEETGSFVREVLLVFFVAMAAIAGVVALAAPLLAQFVAPGVAHDDWVMLTRIMLLQPILLGASNIVAALTQLKHRFIIYAISPLLYNIGIIAGVVWLYPVMGLVGLAWGVVLGAVLHLAVQLPFLFESGTATLRLGETMRRLRQVLALSVPRTAALAAGQVSLLILVAMASLLATGSISVFTFAFNLAAVPLTIIGVSYSVAAFPTLSRLFAAGESSEFVRHLMVALRHIVFWAVPATVMVIVLRAHLVRAILGTGSFDWEATRLTAAALALFVVSLTAQAVTMLIARAYYAAGRTQKPLVFATLGVSVSVASAFALVGVFNTSEFLRYFLESMLRVEDLSGTTVLMLALGYTLGALVAAVVGLVYFARDFRMSLWPLGRLFLQSFSAGVLGGLVAYYVLFVLGTRVDIDTALGVVAQGTAAGVAGLVTIAAVLWLMGNEEIREARRAIKERLAPTPVAIESTEVQS